MTTSPNQASSQVTPAALPVVALVLVVVGFCIPPLFAVGIILAIVSLVKSGEPAYAARKTLAIIALALMLAWIPVIGMLAAIAIPNFLKFKARSVQTECKTNLKMMHSLQASYFREHSAFAESFEELGFSASNNRYLYQITPDEALEPAVAGGRATSDQLRLALEQLSSTPIGVQGACPECTFTGACAGNTDNDPAIDVWTVSSEDRVIDGQPVSAGEPYNHVNDAIE